MLAVAVAAPVQANESKPKLAEGWLTGVIEYVGAPYVSVPRPPHEGWVHVLSCSSCKNGQVCPRCARRLVSLTYVSAGHQFKIRLAAGTYEIFASDARRGPWGMYADEHRGTPRAAKRSHAELGCPRSAAPLEPVEGVR